MSEIEVPLDAVNERCPSCAICDVKRAELYERHHRKMRELQEGLMEQMEALAVVHAEGHNES